jgi:hypothetical protein
MTHPAAPGARHWRTKFRGRFDEPGVVRQGVTEGDAMAYRQLIGDVALIATIGFLAAVIVGAL